MKLRWTSGGPGKRYLYNIFSPDPLHWSLLGVLKYENGTAKLDRGLLLEIKEFEAESVYQAKKVVEALIYLEG